MPVESADWLNDNLLSLDEAALKALLDEEASRDERRVGYLRRIYSRYSRIRRWREHGELGLR